jgi:CheY-like chemotaxis protein
MMDKPTILIVEDEANIRKLAAANLSARGYDVVSVASAEEGLAQLRSHPPSIVLLDIKLPGMQGRDLLATMVTDRDIPSGIPVILMTAMAADMPIRANDYPDIVKVLIKPFAIGDLVRAVGDALR